MSISTGLNAFPLSPLRDGELDEEAFAGLIDRLVAAGVDAITVLGSTGSGAYLSSAQRQRVIEIALERAVSVPIVVGVSALSTRKVLANVRQAQDAAGLLLAPMSYQPLSQREVIDMYRAAAASTEQPLVVYDNPTTTHFAFERATYVALGELPNVEAIKIPPVLGDAGAHVRELRADLPSRIHLGISGDAGAAEALLAGCDGWFSVIGGVLPAAAVELTRAALAGDADAARAASARLAGVWELFAEFGSVRVVDAIARELGLVADASLPLPVQGLSARDRARVAAVIAAL